MPGPLAYRLYQLIWTGLDWLYPPVCAGCGKTGERWCLACHQATELLLPPFCPICGQVRPTHDLCPACQKSPPAFKQLRAWAVFGGKLRLAMHRLKYNHDISMGEILARPLIDMVRVSQWSIDLVTPVPLSLARMAERGYNQAALLAKPLALGLRLPYDSRALLKIKETRTQVGLSVTQRKENVAGVFQARTSRIENKTILLVDDVATSGATLDACAAALNESGAREVFAITLARAVLKPVAIQEA